MSDLCTFDSTLTTFDSTVRTFDSTTCQEVVQQEVAQRARGSRRYRVIDDPDKILEEVKAEEKKVEKAKKRLVILESKAARLEGVLFQEAQQNIEKLEAKVDDRLERIASLMAMIQEGLDDEDDEEVLLL